MGEVWWGVGAGKLGRNKMKAELWIKLIKDGKLTFTMHIAPIKNEQSRVERRDAVDMISVFGCLGV